MTTSESGSTYLMRHPTWKYPLLNGHYGPVGNKFMMCDESENKPIVLNANYTNGEHNP